MSAAADDELEALVAAALEALERDGEAGLAAVLAHMPARAEQVRTIVAHVADLGLVGEARATTLPQRLGDYEVQGELGRGGMGVVYAAIDVRTGAPAAVKVVRPELLADHGARARFRREIAAIARLDHPAIVPVLASGQTDGLPWYAMPRIDGATLERALDHLAATPTVDGTSLQRFLASPGDASTQFQGAYWRVVVRTLLPVGRGLSHAHAQGIVHRDVKPANVLLTPDGRALVFDFGLAQMRGATRLTRTGREPGSPAYMAPEQLRGEPADERTDVYCFAVTLWHALGRRTPFGDAELPELVRRIGSGQAAALPRDVPKALVAVLRRAMDRDRDHRHADVAGLVADLESVLAGQTPTVPKPPSLVRLRRVLADHRALAGAALALLLLLPPVLGTLWWREHRLGAAIAGEKQRADDKVREFEQLADVVRCDRLTDAAASMLPARPERVAELRRWLHDADELLARRPALRAVLAELAPRVAADDASAGRFLHDALASLLQRLEAQLVPLRDDVQRRLIWASQVDTATHAHPSALHSWDAVRAAIAASPRYGKDIPLRSPCVLGLVPLGPNPVTQLWEFYDLASAWDGEQSLASIALPRHRDDGSIAVAEATGIVFVLLPGGTFAMGAQNTDPSAPQYDPKADRDAPLHEVTLAPFLIARHELTRGQWQRLARIGQPTPDTSLYETGGTYFGIAVDATHPAENVDWFTATALLQRHGMLLPTEAQWEYAARGGTTGPWYVEASHLPGAANVADASCKQIAGASWDCEPWSDGHPLHAPVGRLLPNAFGLFDVAGNVFEWCRDEFGDYHDPCDGVEGLRRSGRPRPADADSDVRRARALRGGSWMQRAAYARSAWRNGIGPDFREKEVGLRAMRRMTP